MVANQYLSQGSNRHRVKQPASVPFLWEVRPGLPKKNWKPVPSTTVVDQTAQPPVKLIASVPFKWEEMPGKPLPCFPQAVPLLLLPPPPPMLAEFQSPTHTVYSQNVWDNADDDGCVGDDEEDQMFDSYVDAWGFELDESVSSAPSLVANGLISTLAISNALPVEENVVMDSVSGQLQAPCSPTYESDSSTSSYATGNTSLVGAPFLERLFPLLSPKSSFLGKKGTDTTAQLITGKLDVDVESDHRNLVVTRPLTLGELILMSRRRSYHRKAMLMRDQNLSMEFMKKSALGCCMVGSGHKIKKLEGKLIATQTNLAKLHQTFS